MHTLRALPSLQDNYIWMLSNAAGGTVVVDPGEAAPVLKALQEGLRLVAVLLTHHHPDHIGGLKQILDACRAPVYGPVDARIPLVDFRVGGGDVVHVEALDVNFQVFAVPGHTLSHIAFYDGIRLFSGDTLFSLGCGRLFEGSAAQMLASLDAFAELPGETLVCCGHEYTASNGLFAMHVDPTNAALRRRIADVRDARQAQRPSLPSSIRSERACNPFLRVDALELKHSIRCHTGIDIAEREARFAALRAWKDGFRA